LERDKQAQLVEVKTLLAANYLQRKQYDIADQEIRSALEIDPDNTHANNVMALLKWRLKDYKQADHYFKQAITDQSNSEARNNYGVFLCERGEIDNAVRYFEKAADDMLYKTPEQANLNAGVCLMKKPAPQRAIGYFRAALKIDPKLPAALYHMARIRYDTGNSVSARGFIQRYFEVAEDTPESLLLGVKIERALVNKDAEASYTIRLRGKFPASPEVEKLQSLVKSRRR